MKLHVDGTTYEFDADRMTNLEAIGIEKVTGLYFAEWTEALGKGSMLAVNALVWTIRRRSEPTLKYSDMKYELASIEIEREDEDETAEVEGKEEAPAGGDVNASPTN